MSTEKLPDVVVDQKRVEHYACVNYRRKSSSWLMRAICWILRITHINERFDYYWTTIGQTIYFPSWVEDPLSPQFKAVRAHEIMHLQQFDDYGIVLIACVYLLFPLPFLFSGRWFIEREPYLMDIKSGNTTVEHAVQGIWWGYGWPWPRSWMRNWFNEQIEKGDGATG